MSKIVFKYIKNTMMKFITSKHLKYLKRSLESKHEFSYEELYFKPSYRTKWHKGRYAILQHGTNFFNNLIRVLETVFDSKTKEEWHIKLDLLRIEQEVADFAIAYFWMCPGRWFSRDWRFLNRKHEDLNRKHEDPFIFSKNELNAWQIVNGRFMKIAKDHLPICSVDYFIDYETSA